MTTKNTTETVSEKPLVMRLFESVLPLVRRGNFRLPPQVSLQGRPSDYALLPTGKVKVNNEGRENSVYALQVGIDKELEMRRLSFSMDEFLNATDTSPVPAEIIEKVKTAKLQLQQKHEEIMAGLPGQTTGVPDITAVTSFHFDSKLFHCLGDFLEWVEDNYEAVLYCKETGIWPSPEKLAEQQRFAIRKLFIELVKSQEIGMNKETRSSKKRADGTFAIPLPTSHQTFYMDPADDSGLDLLEDLYFYLKTYDADFFTPALDRQIYKEAQELVMLPQAKEVTPSQKRERKLWRYISEYFHVAFEPLDDWVEANRQELDIYCTRDHIFDREFPQHTLVDAHPKVKGLRKYVKSIVRAITVGGIVASTLGVTVDDCRSRPRDYVFESASSVNNELKARSYHAFTTALDQVTKALQSGNERKASLKQDDRFSITLRSFIVDERTLLSDTSNNGIQLIPDKDHIIDSRKFSWYMFEDNHNGDMQSFGFDVNGKPLFIIPEKAYAFSCNRKGTTADNNEIGCAVLYYRIHVEIKPETKEPYLRIFPFIGANTIDRPQDDEQTLASLPPIEIDISPNTAKQIDTLWQVWKEQKKLLDTSPLPGDNVQPLAQCSITRADPGFTASMNKACERTAEKTAELIGSPQGIIEGHNAQQEVPLGTVGLLNVESSIAIDGKNYPNVSTGYIVDLNTFVTYWTPNQHLKKVKHTKSPRVFWYDGHNIPYKYATSSKDDLTVITFSKNVFPQYLQTPFADYYPRWMGIFATPDNNGGVKPCWLLNRHYPDFADFDALHFSCNTEGSNPMIDVAGKVVSIPFSFSQNTASPVMRQISAAEIATLKQQAVAQLSHSK